MRINWRAVVRDAVLIYLLTFLGGFVLGFSGIRVAENPTVYRLVSSFLSVVALTISACIMKSNRLRHLFLVVVAVWIIASTNIPLGFETFSSWFGSIVYFAILALVAWGLSYVFLRLAGGSEPAK